MKLPYYEKPLHPLIPIGDEVKVHMMEVVNFLKWTLERDHLDIATYLPEMGTKSFFLVAATGLGKTVGVPIHVLLRQLQRAGRRPNPTPRVWVVEPRIPIAMEQAEYMNHLWDEYCEFHSRDKRRTSPLFGCVTSVSGRVNPDAPIQFVTTGIFELMSREGSYYPWRDRIIIDEAHVTVEQNPGVELGIALTRKDGVTIDYMSATVDVTGLKEQLGVSNVIRADGIRNIIWKSNLLRPIDEVIGELVQNTLVKPDSTSRFYPKGDYKQAKQVIDSALEPGRSHGMLIVVNSFNGDTSDTRKLTNKLREAHPHVPVLHLASDVIRDPRRQADFGKRLVSIEARKENYIIIATSVVEMGITFPTLDYVVTMDAGYDQETIGDVTFPVVAALGVNSLLQRIGRVGRRRPGIAYISNEVGADYSSLEDDKLNGSALAYEPIHYPLSSAPLMSLAYYAAQQTWDDLDKWLTDLKLPSKIQEDEDRMEFFHEQFEKLELLGITQDGKLTELGARMEQWMGRADIAYAAHLQTRLAEGASREEVLFWVVATALSNTSASSLKAQHGHFVDYDGSHKEIANRIDIWSGYDHEDIAIFRAMAVISKDTPHLYWNRQARNELNDTTLYKWCNWAGLDARKFVKAGQAISDTIMLFTKVNATSPEFKRLFGNDHISAATIDWEAVYRKLPVKTLERQLKKLAGVTKITLKYVEAMNAYEWSDGEHGHTGLLSQDSTPIQLDDSKQYSARIIPSRQAKGDKTEWRLASLGVTQPRKPSSTKAKQKTVEQKVVIEKPRKRSFLERLFGR